MNGNLRKIIVLFGVVVLSAAFFGIKERKPTQPPQRIQIEQPRPEPSGAAHMPVVKEINPLLAQIRNGIPQPNRSKEFAKWLQCGFRIRVENGSGSGTLCYYDPKKKLGYVISCAHLWNGGIFRRSSGGQRTATITTWYQNNKKLPQPKNYTAEVIFYDSSKDVSLLTFHPDWVPDIYYPIATVQKLKRGERAHSVGCDHAEEVADYIVEVIGLSGDPRGGSSITTQYNSPRPGRSGGGLINKEGYYVGICWGTSNKDGTGIGYFVPLETIHAAYREQGYGFLIGKPLPGLGRMLPIFDHDNPNKKYPRDFILMPER